MRHGYIDELDAQLLNKHDLLRAAPDHIHALLRVSRKRLLDHLHPCQLSSALYTSGVLESPPWPCLFPFGWHVQEFQGLLPGCFILFLQFDHKDDLLLKLIHHDSRHEHFGRSFVNGEVQDLFTQPLGKLFTATEIVNSSTTSITSALLSKI